MLAVCHCWGPGRGLPTGVVAASLCSASQGCHAPLTRARKKDVVTEISVQWSQHPGFGQGFSQVVNVLWISIPGLVRAQCFQWVLSGLHSCPHRPFFPSSFHPPPLSPLLLWGAFCLVSPLHSLLQKLPSSPARGCCPWVPLRGLPRRPLACQGL